SIISDNMVLQQKTNAKIWGRANGGETVNVKCSWSNKIYTTKADSCGKWSLYVKTPKQGKNHSMEIFTFTHNVSVENILIGEVWL
ncbi:MAG: sialate O-acetylesterase, partial [Bacteroidia bacterium]|nr:sialate O-acetylesterase [Bacteroidia bacterium]